MDQLSENFQAKTDKNEYKIENKEKNSEKNKINNEKDTNKEKTPIPSKVNINIIKYIK